MVLSLKKDSFRRRIRLIPNQKKRNQAMATKIHKAICLNRILISRLNELFFRNSVLNEALTFYFMFFPCVMPIKMCMAQDVIKQPAQLKFQATYFSPRTYTDTTQKFNLQTYNAELAFSLGRIQLDTGIITFNGSIKQQIQPIQLFDSDPQRLLLTSSIGIRTMYLDYKRIRGYLVFSNRLQIQSDEKNWSKQSPRYAGTLLYSRMNAKKWRWNYGLAYSYVYGKGFLFPLLGFIYKPDSHQTWRAVLPFLFSYQYKSQCNIFTLACIPAGGRNAITSPWGTFDGENLARIFVNPC